MRVKLSRSILRILFTLRELGQEQGIVLGAFEELVHVRR